MPRRKEAEVTFTIDDGRAVEFSRVPPMLKRAIAIFEGLPLGQLMTSRGAAARLTPYFLQLTNHPAVARYCVKEPAGRLWGNPQTIELYLKKKASLCQDTH